MNYKIIACTNTAYVGWVVAIPRLHKGALKVTRSDGVAATFAVEKIIKGKIVTLANSNFVVQLEAV